jgi:hypothetical protein
MSYRTLDAQRRWLLRLPARELDWREWRDLLGFEGDDS